MHRLRIIPDLCCTSVEVRHNGLFRIQKKSSRIKYDVIIIGAGLYGIQAARTWLEIHPYDNIVVFEAGDSAGGVWSAERMYDAFWTQTTLRIAEFSDQPMHHVPPEERYYDFFPAKHVTRYLDDYVRSHVYADQSLADRIVLGACVKSLEKRGRRWVVHLEGDSNQYMAPRVIDASGITSIQNTPTIRGQEEYNGLTLHHKQFGQSDFLSDGNYKHVVVIGGAKSAADVVYAAAKAGKKVSWIIRKSGSGPAAYGPAQGQGLYKNSNEFFYTRLVSRFLASLFAEDNWATRLLYRTPLGTRLVQRIWRGIHQKVLKMADYGRADGRDSGFANLKPDTEIFWQNDSTGVNQRPDFFDTVASKVIVYRQDVHSFGPSEVILDDGRSIAADVVVYATGWSALHPHLEPSVAADLGLPVTAQGQDPVEAAKWQALEQQADREILQKFRILAHPPQYRKSDSALTPFRLYNGMLPVQDHSIVFVGKLMLSNHFRNGEVQALWAVAALDGKLSLPSERHMRKDIARTVAWCRRRYLAKGQLGNWFYWDMVPYTDSLLKHLGLSSHRKSWWRDLFRPCFAEDLKRLIEEYKMKHGIEDETSYYGPVPLRPKL